MMKVLLITGNELRHRFFAKSLSLNLDLVGVIFEKKANKHTTYDYDKQGRKIVDQHFAGRTTSEKEYFDDERILNIELKNVLELATGESNNETIFQWIKDCGADVIQLFGSSLIKNHILDAYPQKVVNLHLGLSPYYRGSGTNFWPLVHQKPECVGATIHLAVKKVDAGGILHQYRPEIHAFDTVHDVGNKTILKGIQLLPEVLQHYHQAKISPITQNLDQGIVCYRKDLTPASIQKLYHNFETGMLTEFVGKRAQRLAQYPIVNQLSQ